METPVGLHQVLRKPRLRQSDLQQIDPIGLGAYHLLRDRSDQADLGAGPGHNRHLGLAPGNVHVGYADKDEPVADPPPPPFCNDARV